MTTKSPGWRVSDFGSALSDLATHGWARLPTPATLGQSLEELESAATRFFAQTESEKLRSDIRTSRGHRGYVPTAEQGNYADEDQRRYEAFDIGREARPGDRVDHPLRGKNRWPEDPSFRRAASDTFDALEDLAEALGHAICTHLGVQLTRFSELRSEPVSQLRVIRYREPEVLDVRPLSAPAAMGAHTDYEFFTFFHQNKPGLQILERDGHWVQPDLVDDTILILPGDLLEVFSGGVFVSTLHRVGSTVEPNRVSIPFFCGADFDAEVQSVAGTAERPLRFGEHLMSQLLRDFPYLRATSYSGEARDPVVISLADSDRDGQQSIFEQRRKATMASADVSTS